jgi:hypothetical protein
MWPWSSKKAAAPSQSLRETFFGDVPLSAWASARADEPWASFEKAEARMEQGDRSGAVEVLESIVQRSGLESRHYVQAWSSLRTLGVSPPPGEAKHVYGVVVDVPVESGLDTLAAYEDGTARYINFSGAAIIWDVQEPRMIERIEKLVSAGKTLASLIGPWEGVRPSLPSGQARISLLTPSGLHFGQAPLNVLTEDAMAAPLLAAATELMQALIQSSRSAHEKS